MPIAALFLVLAAPVEGARDCWRDCPHRRRGRELLCGRAKNLRCESWRVRVHRFRSELFVANSRRRGVLGACRGWGPPCSPRGIRLRPCGGRPRQESSSSSRCPHDASTILRSMRDTSGLEIRVRTMVLWRMRRLSLIDAALGAEFTPLETVASISARRLYCAGKYTGPIICVLFNG